MIISLAITLTLTLTLAVSTVRWRQARRALFLVSRLPILLGLASISLIRVLLFRRMRSCMVTTLTVRSTIPILPITISITISALASAALSLLALFLLFLLESTDDFRESGDAEFLIIEFAKLFHLLGARTEFFPGVSSKNRGLETLESGAEFVHLAAVAALDLFKENVEDSPKGVVVYFASARVGADDIVEFFVRSLGLDLETEFLEIVSSLS